jgi:hypothetical protein
MPAWLTFVCIAAVLAAMIYLLCVVLWPEKF